MLQKLQALVVAVLFTVALGTGAHAATLTYENAQTTPKMQVIIDDAAAPGKFRFSISTLVGNADYLGFGFNYSGASIVPANISLVSATKLDDGAITPTLALYGNNTGSQNDCGGGCNFNGAGSATHFDYIIGIGAQGGGGPGGINYVKTVVFEIMVPGSLAANPFSQLAIRAQTTSNPSGSIKADMVLAAVPLPAGLPLLVFGLGALALLRRHRAA